VPSYRILVVDGDPPSRNFVANILRKEGHVVLQAASGEEGLVVALREAPQLIIADPMLSDLPGEALATRIRSDPRTAQIPLVALSHSARTARLRGWLESGFDDYVVKSPQVVPLLKASLDDLLGSGTRVRREGGLLIAFLSAKGGLGTSSLCANVASSIAASESDKRVVLADLVLPMGSIAEIVGYEGQHELVSISYMPASQTTAEELERILPRVEHWYFRLLAGCRNPDKAARLNFARIGRLVSALKSAFDYVVLDLGRSLSRISLPLIEAADLVVVVATMERDAVDLTRNSVEFLQSRGVQASAMYLMMNRAIQVESLSKEECEQVIRLPIKAAMPHLGGNLSLANHWHQPYALKFGNDAAGLILKRAAQEIAAAAKSQRSL
jgi:CheY-like chemotaxis protein